MYFIIHGINQNYFFLSSSKTKMLFIYTDYFQIGLNRVLGESEPKVQNSSSAAAHATYHCRNKQQCLIIFISSIFFASYFPQSNEETTVFESIKHICLVLAPSVYRTY